MGPSSGETVGEDQQRVRNRFIRDHLPAEENEWPGTTFATHVLGAVEAQEGDTDFQEELSDALIGQRMSLFGKDPELEERIGLTIETAQINDDAIVVTFAEEPEVEYSIDREDSNPDWVYSFQVPRELDS